MEDIPLAAAARTTTTVVPPTLGTGKVEYLFSDVPERVRGLLQTDEVALYSVSPAWMSEILIRHLTNIVGRRAVVTDATACVGGDTFRLCGAFKYVNAVESDPDRASMLTWNLGVLGCENVRVVRNSYLSVCTDLSQDVVFIDAPWGGPEYKLLRKVNLFLDEMPLSDICARVWHATSVIALKVPKNFDIQTLKDATAATLPNSHIAVLAMGPAKLVLIRKKLKIA